MKKYRATLLCDAGDMYHDSNLNFARVYIASEADEYIRELRYERMIAKASAMVKLREYYREIKDYARFEQCARIAESMERKAVRIRKGK